MGETIGSILVLECSVGEMIGSILLLECSVGEPIGSILVLECSVGETIRVNSSSRVFSRRDDLGQFF